MKLNKMAGALLAVAVTASSALFGAEETESIKNKKPNGCIGPVLCTQNPMLSKSSCICDAGWQFEIGLIYEQPRFGRMDAGYSYSPTYAQGASQVDVKKLEQTFDYSLGLLLDLGTYLAHDNWYLGVHFDWLNTNKSATYAAGSTVEYQTTTFFDDLALTAETETFYDSIAYKASMEFFTLDVSLSRGSYMSGNFAFEPVAGIEALWFSTSQNMIYDPNFASTDVVYNSKQNNWGVGPRIGLNSLYHVVQELYFFCDTSVAVLMGEAKLNDTSTGTAGVRTFLDFQKNQFYVPVRSVLGVKFAKYVLEEKHYLALKVGYDARAVISATDSGVGFVSGGLYINGEWSF